MIIDEIRECIEKMNGEKMEIKISDIQTEKIYRIKTKYMYIDICMGKVNAYMRARSYPVKNNKEILHFLESLRNSDLF